MSERGTPGVIVALFLGAILIFIWIVSWWRHRKQLQEWEAKEKEKLERTAALSILTSMGGSFFFVDFIVQHPVESVLLAFLAGIFVGVGLAGFLLSRLRLIGGR